MEALGIFYFLLFMVGLPLLRPQRVELPFSNLFPASSSQAEVYKYQRNLDRRRRLSSCFQKWPIQKGKLTPANSYAVLAPPSRTSGKRQGGMAGEVTWSRGEGQVGNREEESTRGNKGQTRDGTHNPEGWGDSGWGARWGMVWPDCERGCTIP